MGERELREIKNYDEKNLHFETLEEEPLFCVAVLYRATVVLHSKTQDNIRTSFFSFLSLCIIHQKQHLHHEMCLKIMP